MALIDYLKTWTLPLPAPSSLRAPARLAAARNRVESMFSGIPTRSPRRMDLEAAYQRVRLRWERQRSLIEVASSDLRLVPYILFHFPGRDQSRLGGDPTFASHYLAWVERSGLASPLRRLVHALLLHYPQRLPTFELWRQETRRRVLATGSSGHVNLRRRCEEHHLLADEGAEWLASQLTGRPEPVDEVLAEAGLSGELATGGYVLSAYRQAMRSAPEAVAPQGATRLERLLALSERRDQAAGQTGLRFPEAVFPEAATELVEGLLSPYATGRGHDSHRETIKGFLLRHFRDPRIARGGVWGRAHEDCRRVMCRWLAERNLEDFFRILDGTADPIWRYRRKFWLAYLKKHPDMEVWAVLGKQASIIAKNMFEDEHGFGRLIGALRNQSVLLMRIQDIVIGEWSHSGTCRIWNLAEPLIRDNAPRLYDALKVYRRDHLVSKASFEKEHRGSDRYKWQGDVAEYIHRSTGIWVRPPEYRV